jgi:hypothetical protein
MVDAEEKTNIIKKIKLFQFLLEYHFSLKNNLSIVVRTQNKRCARIPEIKHPTTTHHNPPKISLSAHKPEYVIIKSFN